MQILPDLDRVEGFLLLKSPTSKEEAQSLLGLLATFKRLKPSFASNTENLCKLTNKLVHFSLDQFHIDELEAIRVSLQNLLPLSLFDL